MARTDGRVTIPLHDGEYLSVAERTDDDGGTWIEIVTSRSSNTIVMSRQRARRLAHLLAALAAREYDDEEEP